MTEVRRRDIGGVSLRYGGFAAGQDADPLFVGGDKVAGGVDCDRVRAAGEGVSRRPVGGDDHLRVVGAVADDRRDRRRDTGGGGDTDFRGRRVDGCRRAYTFTTDTNRVEVPIGVCGASDLRVG